MATLVLTAAGSVFGPIGAAIGAVAGRSIDAQIFNSGTRQGPRLKELSVSTSSYGTPMAGHYGTVRTPGTIFWATDLQENSSSEGGGKGKPETTSYTYSVSFAVALSSLPIDGSGRIWADGNLLRGSAGDLKAGGSLRIHRGTRDQDKDPLLEAELGSECPAHRGLAYAVFEDLDLTDFGNRIPALSFEVFAGQGNRFLDGLLETTAVSAGGQADFPELNSPATTSKNNSSNWRIESLKATLASLGAPASARASLKSPSVARVCLSNSSWSRLSTASMEEV